jgi:endonuclease/exonuclease/phosphatase family metal-dependent hydrolase
LIHAHAPVGRRLAVILASLVFALLLPGLAGATQKENGHRGYVAKVHSHHGHGKRHRHHHGKHHGHHGRGHDHGHPGRGDDVDVMTRNLYLGANLTPAIMAPSLEAFVAANGKILNEVTENSFPTRAEGLADEILAKKPDLVGLQEVALWRTAPPSLAPLQTGPSATTVRYDYLQELLAELNEGNGKGGNGKPRYEVVVVQDEFDLEAPADENGKPNDGPAEQGIPNAEINGRLTMRDVILARSDAGVHTWNAQGANFTLPNLLPVKILNVTIPIKRGWTATDARVRGSGPFRFVNTHLEAFDPPELVPSFRAKQAGELVAPGGPATSELPVILVGDLNSDDDTVAPGDRQAYEALVAAGMVERSTNVPLSCCIDSSLLAVGKGGSEADFDHQVDHVMTRDPDDVTLESSSVTGIQPVNGFWSSDHAGVFSALELDR